MKYLDNLIAWGDYLFRQDTIESINEATQLYVLAANILGPRPQQIPPRGTVRPKTFAQLKASSQDPIGNALVELEGAVPVQLLDRRAAPSGDARPPARSSASAAPCTSASRATTSCSATGTRWPIGCSRSATA